MIEEDVTGLAAALAHLTDMREEGVGRGGALGDGTMEKWQHAWEVRAARFPREIVFARPSSTIAISVTGQQCVLDCAHCGRHYLAGMRPMPHALEIVRERHPKSVLLSGGCDLSGRVPLGDWPRRVAESAPGVRINCHAGLVSDAEAEEIAQWVDAVSFDVTTDQRVISQVYGLRKSPEEYIASYVSLAKRVPTVPHVCIGLAGPSESLSSSSAPPEIGALEAILETATGGEAPMPPAIVFIVFTPTPRTRMASVPAPEPGLVRDIIAEARLMFPDTLINLGCMRPGGMYRGLVDAMAIDAGVNLIVQPAPEVAEHARALGLAIVDTDECCALLGCAST